MMDATPDLQRRNLMLAGTAGALALVVPAAGAAPAASAADKVSLDALKALLDAYLKAFSAHDAKAALALFAPNAVIVGTGPGEIWGGTAEIGEAHANFFKGFDPGKQESESLFRQGNIVGDMAWLISMSKVRFTKGSDVTEFGLNTSVVFEKTAGKWLIRAMHLSNLTAAEAKA